MTYGMMRRDDVTSHGHLFVEYKSQMSRC